MPILTATLAIVCIAFIAFLVYVIIDEIHDSIRHGDDLDCFALAVLAVFIAGFTVITAILLAGGVAQG